MVGISVVLKLVSAFSFFQSCFYTSSYCLLSTLIFSILINHAQNPIAASSNCFHVRFLVFKQIKYEKIITNRYRSLNKKSTVGFGDLSVYFKTSK